MAKVDPGHDATDELIKKYERRIRKEYRQAEKELEAKFNEHCRKFKAKYDIKLKQLAEGAISKTEFNDWVTGQLFVGTRWNEMRRTMAEDLLLSNEKARSIADGYRAEAYALNHDYATFLVERDSMIDTSYTLYNRQAAERMIKDEKTLPKPGKKVEGEIARGEAIRWREGQIQSITLQSILQGESLEKMAHRISETVSVRDASTALRYARTALTGAQNAGREDAFKRAEQLGIPMVQQWSATLDNHTRSSHRMLDGETREVGERFSNGCRFPGDPEGDAEEIWNCRCRLNGYVKGHEKDPSDLSRRMHENMEEKTYEEWKSAKPNYRHKKVKKKSKTEDWVD